MTDGQVSQIVMQHRYIEATWTAFSSLAQGAEYSIMGRDIGAESPQKEYVRSLPLVVDLASAFLLGLGAVTLLLLPCLYWLIHGDAERFQWIIRGPAPFNNLGSGPYLLWLGLAIFLSGLGMILSGLALRRRFLKILVKRVKQEKGA